jgi:hypothetical protein
MKSLFSKTIVLSSLVIASTLAITACHKKKDTLALIHVKDKDNNAVVSCRVILKGVSTTVPAGNVTLYDTAYTDEDGVASFNFNDTYQSGQAGVAVLNIEAKKNQLKGTGIIKIEEEVTNEETVFVQ